MFTFDATWMLILALSKLRANDIFPKFSAASSCLNIRVRNYEKLREYLSTTNFSGITGPIHFNKKISNDRSEGFYYGLYIIQEERTASKENIHSIKTVQTMYWSQEEKIWKFTSESKNNRTIWPGETAKDPSSDTKKLKSLI